MRCSKLYSVFIELCVTCIDSLFKLIVVLMFNIWNDILKIEFCHSLTIVDTPMLTYCGIDGIRQMLFFF